MSKSKFDYALTRFKKIPFGKILLSKENIRDFHTIIDNILRPYYEIYTDDLFNLFFSILNKIDNLNLYDYYFSERTINCSNEEHRELYNKIKNDIIDNLFKSDKFLNISANKRLRMIHSLLNLDQDEIIEYARRNELPTLKMIIKYKS